MEKKWTKATNTMVAKKIVKFLKEIEALDNVSIVYNGWSHSYTDGKEVSSYPRTAKEVTEYGNNKTITLVYDGGILYSFLNCEYGWKTKDRFDKAMDEILRPYGAYFENCHSWCSTIWM